MLVSRQADRASDTMIENLSTLDYETDMMRHGEIHSTRMVGYYDGRTYRDFKTTANLNTYLRLVKRKQYIAHHGNFDVLQALNDGANVRIMRAHKARIIRCIWHGHTLQNSVSLLPMRLADAMAEFGVKKLPLTMLKQRNRSDCVELYRILRALDAACMSTCGVSLLEAGTLAGTGMRAAKIVAGPLPVDARWPQAKRGAHTEIYQQGVFDVDVYDIHSSYPASILDAPAKARLLHVWVKSNDQCGAFFDTRLTERLVFPQGTFESYVFEDVLERYIKPYWHGKLRVIRVIDVDLSWLVALKPLVCKLYSLKRDSKNAVIVMMAKLILNALYGRIGLKPRREVIFQGKGLPAFDEIGYYTLSRGRCIAFKECNATFRGNYPMASYILDNARGRWYQMVKENWGKVLYGDTDSVFVPYGSKLAGNFGSECGQWGFAWRDTVRLRGNKDYEILNRIGRIKRRVLKGGRSSIQWTLKTMLAGHGVQFKQRQHRSVIHKRQFDVAGQSKPLRVGV